MKVSDRQFEDVYILLQDSKTNLCSRVLRFGKVHKLPQLLMELIKMNDRYNFLYKERKMICMQSCSHMYFFILGNNSVPCRALNVGLITFKFNMQAPLRRL